MSATIFSNAEIIAAIGSGDLKIERFENGQYVAVPQPDVLKLDRHSNVQPASLDLTIGKIYQPPGIQWKPSELPNNPPYKTGHELAVGGTVVVETREKLAFSAKIGAFAFPPASMAKNSILVTNLGHVDPGFEGHLTFTIINMGRVPYDLQFGKSLATLLVFGFEQPVARDYSALTDRGETTPNRMPEVLNRLSPDFADFELRAQESAMNAAEAAIATQAKKLDGRVETAKSQYQNAERKHNIHVVAWPAGAAVLAAGISGFISYTVATSGYANKDTLDIVDERVETLEENHVLPSNLESLADRLDDLRRTVATSTTVSSLNDRVERLEGENLLESLDERLRWLENAIEALGSGEAIPEKKS